MKNVWAYITYLTSFVTLSPVSQDASPDPLHGRLDANFHGQIVDVNDITDPISIDSGHPRDNFPVFGPPSWAGHDFKCEYPDLKDYVPCSHPDDRSCWLRHKYDSRLDYNIHTDYEKYWPKGKVREYVLEVEDGRVNADGLWATNRQLVNGTYPGPWLHACWGDTVRVKVINKLKHNGTAIHFHGVRQHNTMHMDGVPGVTQCPIAPNDYFVYEFVVKQYGSSWYHSHYSVQYADGMLGAMTFHGPSSATWDEATSPLMMTDWFHNSAFEVIHGEVPGYPTALLNGRGDITKHEYEVKAATTKEIDEFEEEDEEEEIVSDGDVDEERKRRKKKKKKPINKGKRKITPNAPIPAKHLVKFQKAEPKKRYLLRLINTSFTTTFIFSIDHHKMIIVGADFVPMNAGAARTHVVVGIGQRYTVVVEAAPQAYVKPPGYDLKKQSSFWIRTSAASCLGASTIGVDDYNRTGIIRYSDSDMLDPITVSWPEAKRAEDACEDEKDLVPTLEWNIGPPSNGKSYGEEFTVILDTKRTPDDFPLGKWALERYEPDKGKRVKGWHPLRIDYSDPFFLNLDQPKDAKWPHDWVIIPESHDEDDWIYLAVTGLTSRDTGKKDIVAHPMHLHGHDFAVLEQVYGKHFPYDDENGVKFKFEGKNPLRRDVVLLPQDGYVILAFKADNPGAWLMHCHIAFHASEGLALTINERQHDAHKIWRGGRGKMSFAKTEAERVCQRWRSFEDDCTQHWPGWNETRGCWPACRDDKPKEKAFACSVGYKEPGPFKDDSGV